MVHVHGACACACTCAWCTCMCMCMVHVHVHVHGACAWCTCMVHVHVHVHGACAWCTCMCRCMCMSMVHVPRRAVLLNATLTAHPIQTKLSVIGLGFVGIVGGDSHWVAAPIAYGGSHTPGSNQTKPHTSPLWAPVGRCSMPPSSPEVEHSRPWSAGCSVTVSRAAVAAT